MDLPQFYFSRFRPAACIRISGEDAATYLQGQFSNQLKHAEPHSATYGFWLSYKGKVEADSFVLACQGGVFLLVSYYCDAPALLEKLERNIIADDVILEDLTEEHTLWVFGGKSAPEFLKSCSVAELPEASAFVHANGGHLFRGRHLRALHYDWLLPHGSLDLEAKFQDWARANNGAELDIELARVCAQVPAVPQDIGPGELPQEGGLADAGVSLNKGCYLGQEVMSRLSSMGSVQRQLYSVSLENTVPELPAELFYEGRLVGQLRSAVQVEQGAVGIALLKKRIGDEAPRLSFEAEGEACVQVHNPIVPFP